MNSSLLDKIGIDPAIILIILLVLVIVLFGLVFYLMANIKKRNKDIKRLLSGKTAGDMEEIILDRFAEMDAVKNNSKRLTKEHKEIQETLAACISKIGLVKYDAFQEMGGKLSFSLAMLNEEDDGFVINAVHSREGCYTYIKEIVGGNSIIVLADEEQEALDMAKEANKPAK